MAGSINAHEFPKRITIFVSLVLFLIALGSVGYMILAGASLGDSFVMTLESFAFMIHPAGSPILKALGIFLSLFGVIAIWWILWGVFDLFLEGNLSKYLKIRDHMSKLKNMKNHYIIAGGGRVGLEIAHKLRAEKKEHIIIEKDADVVSRLKKEGFLAVKGDVSDENVLKEHNIAKAKALVLTLPETEKNIMITMSAKELAPDIFVYARSDKPNFVSKLKKAGADFVIVPEMAAAEKMLGEMFLREKK
jgi:voltage-gated potassium channel